MSPDRPPFRAGAGNQRAKRHSECEASEASHRGLAAREPASPGDFGSGLEHDGGVEAAAILALYTFSR
jgi:hypothetical protein